MPTAQLQPPTEGLWAFGLAARLSYSVTVTSPHLLHHQLHKSSSGDGNVTLVPPAPAAEVPPLGTTGSARPVRGSQDRGSPVPGRCFWPAGALLEESSWPCRLEAGSRPVEVAGWALLTEIAMESHRECGMFP